jgi:hypothetical protein
MLILPMLFGAFQPPKPAPLDRPRSFPRAENKNCQHIAMSGGYIYILGSQQTVTIKVRTAARSCSRALVVEKLRTATAETRQHVTYPPWSR